MVSPCARRKPHTCTVATCVPPCHRERDGHLLDDGEATLLASIVSLPHEPLSLLLRLLLRRRVWHPVASIAFDDVPDAAAAAERLAETGLAVLDNSVHLGADLNSLLEGLPADTIKSALAQLAPARHPVQPSAGAGSGGKAALVSAAMVRCGTGRGHWFATCRAHGKGNMMAQLPRLTIL